MHNWDLPFGRGRHFGANASKVVDAVAGGWRFSGVTTLYSGIAFTPTISNAPLVNADFNYFRPDIIGNPNVSNPSAAEWFNPAAYTAPQAPYRNGDAGKGTLRGPGLVVLNLALAKVFSIAERKTLEFRWENFNALNHVNLGMPNNRGCLRRGPDHIHGESHAADAARTPFPLLKRNHIFVMKTSRVTVAALSLCACLAAAELPKAPPAPHPDYRFKADILVIVAHPDDETEITGYLAKAVYEEHRRVAVIFGTRGDGGGNAEGYEQAAALGAEREIEGRRALASFGIMNVWFLGGPDTPGQDVLRSLETWNHGAALAQAVRLVRLTRPEVILTWLPVYVAGENHGDHQAAGVIATEAFDLAGDATVLPEQIAPPRERMGISNLTEGLHTWQPKKLYYFSDASHTDFLEGKGPRYATTGMSASHHVPYYRMAADEMSFHLTQDDTGQLARQAIAKGDFKYFEQPVMLVLGKSHVRSSITGDIFEGVEHGPIPFVPAHGYRAPQDAGLTVELGGPWRFYREFWKAHGLDLLAGLLPSPEASLASGERLHLPLLIHNGTGEARDVTLTAVLPGGWTVAAGQAVFPVDARETYPVETVLVSPSKADPPWQTVVWKAASGGQTIGSIAMRVNLGNGGLPQ